MSLKDEINNTNTQKENLKIGKKNIDNKLVKLGGEQSTDLADVPNKIEKCVEEYIKYAYIQDLAPIKLRDYVYAKLNNYDYNEQVEFKFQTNFDFIPKAMYMEGVKIVMENAAFSLFETNFKINNLEPIFLKFKKSTNTFTVKIELKIINEKESTLLISVNVSSSGWESFEDWLDTTITIKGTMEVFSKKIIKR